MTSAAPAPGQKALALRDTAHGLSRSLPPLLVEAECIAMTLAPGVHGRRRAGVGETFWQYRHYGDGDPASAVDWRQSARGDRLYVRENEWEAAHTVYFWTDGSPSMDFASREDLETKHHRAAILTLALGHLLIRAGERIGPLDGQIRPSASDIALRHMAETLSLSPALPLGEVPNPVRLPRFSRVILISDFLMDLEILSARLRDFGGRGTHGHLVHVLDPAEEDLPYTGRTEFEDVEDNTTMTLGRAEAVRSAYQEKMRDHRQALQAIAARWGWTVTGHRTDEPARNGLVKLYNLVAGSKVRAGL